MKTSVFSQVRSTRENLKFSLHEMKILWFSLNKKIFFYFIVNTPKRASDVITNVTKQNMNAMESMFSAKTCSAGETKTNKFRQIKITLLPKCSLHSN